MHLITLKNVDYTCRTHFTGYHVRKDVVAMLEMPEQDCRTIPFRLSFPSDN